MYEIISHASYKTINNMCLVNKQSYDMFSTNNFWIKIFERDFFNLDTEYDIKALYKCGIDINRVFKIISIFDMNHIMLGFISDHAYCNTKIKELMNIDNKDVKINNTIYVDLQDKNYVTLKIDFYPEYFLYTFREYKKLLIKMLYYIPHLMIEQNPPLALQKRWIKYFFPIKYGRDKRPAMTRILQWYKIIESLEK
jgi:hypothetical protein